MARRPSEAEPTSYTADVAPDTNTKRGKLRWKAIRAEIFSGAAENIQEAAQPSQPALVLGRRRSTMGALGNTIGGSYSRRRTSMMADTSIARLQQRQREINPTEFADRVYETMSTIAPSRWTAVQRLQIQSHLEGLSFFLQAGIAGTYLSELLHSFKQRSLAPDELLFAQGDAPDYFYVLVRGSLQFLFQTDDGRQKLAGAAGAGDSFGELALLTGKPRSTTARAKTACLLLVFTPQVFARYLSRPASRLMSGVIGQLRELPVIARGISERAISDHLLLTLAFLAKARTANIRRRLHMQWPPPASLAAAAAAAAHAAPAAKTTVSAVTTVAEVKGEVEVASASAAPKLELCFVLKGEAQLVAATDRGELNLCAFTKGQHFGDVAAFAPWDATRDDDGGGVVHQIFVRANTAVELLSFAHEDVINFFPAALVEHLRDLAAQRASFQRRLLAATLRSRPPPKPHSSRRSAPPPEAPPPPPVAADTALPPEIAPPPSAPPGVVLGGALAAGRPVGATLPFITQSKSTPMMRPRAALAATRPSTAMQSLLYENQTSSSPSLARAAAARARADDDDGSSPLPPLRKSPSSPKKSASPKKESAAWADDEDGPVLRVARRPPSLRGGDRETRALVVVAPRHKSRLWTMVPAVNVDDAAASLRRGRGVRVEAGGAARWSPRGLRELDL